LDYYLQKQQEIKGQLIEYIQQEKDLNLDWRDEVLKLLSEHNLKFIKCF
jgi:CO dehydrogenase/acetyl-CoA synthase alpha subunit